MQLVGYSLLVVAVWSIWQTAYLVAMVALVIAFLLWADRWTDARNKEER